MDFGGAAFLLLGQCAMQQAGAQAPNQAVQPTMIGQVVVITAPGVVIKTEFTGPFKSPAQCYQLMRLLLKSSNDLPLPITKVAAACEIQAGHPKKPATEMRLE